MAKIEAVDGDKQNKRLIRYGFLTDSNPFVVFFDLDPMSGKSIRSIYLFILAIDQKKFNPEYVCMLEVYKN